jgi:hypothetical protein
MATPKFDRIITEFSLKISDPATFVSGVLQNGNVLTASEKVHYVNRALFKLFETVVAQNKDKNAIAAIFPELIANATNVSFTPGAAYGLGNGLTYVVSSPYLDFSNIVLNAYAHFSIPSRMTVLSPEMLSIVASGINTGYIPSVENTFLIPNGRILYAYPSGFGTQISFQYIKLPLNNLTGGLLTQNGSVDSPFSDAWTSTLADIAAQIYYQDSQLG